MPPAIKKLHRPFALGAGVSEYVRWSLNDMGAVVVVEDEMALPIPKLHTGLQLFGGRLRLFSPHAPLPSDLPAPGWSDPASGAPGNPAGKSFPLGWGY